MGVIHQKEKPAVASFDNSLDGVDYDPLKNKAYQSTRLGRDVVDFLAWLELADTSPRTLDQYERDLARGCLMFPSKGITELDDGDLLHIAKSFKPGERRVRIAAYKSFFKWARVQRRTIENPTELLPDFKVQSQRFMPIFADVEIEALLGLPIVDAAPMAVLLEAGLRKAEARHLQLQDCLPESGQVIVLRGKGSKDRVVPMSGRLKHLLNELVLTERLEATDHIFYAMRANHMTRSTVRDTPIGEGTFARWWVRCLSAAGVKPGRKPRRRTPHSCRHTYATRWRRRGLAIDEIQILLGHASIRTTSDLYVHTNVADVAEHMTLIEAQETLQSEARE